MWNAIILFERKGKRVYCNHFCFAWGLTLYSLSILTRFESSFLISRILLHFRSGTNHRNRRKQTKKSIRNAIEQYTFRHETSCTYTRTHSHTHTTLKHTHIQTSLPYTVNEKHRCPSKCNQTEMRTYVYDVCMCTARKENEEETKQRSRSAKCTRDTYSNRSIMYAYNSRFFWFQTPTYRSNRETCFAPLHLPNWFDRYIVKSKYEENK